MAQSLKQLLIVASASFVICLLCSLSLVQVGAGVIFETRKSALVKTLSEAQLNSGAIHFFENVTRTYNEWGTSDALLILRILESSDRIDASKTLAYVSSMQRNDSGSFGADYGGDGTLLSYDMGNTYYVIRALKAYDALNLINTTAVANFLLDRYNGSTGSFHELPTEAYGTVYAMASFSLGFHTWNYGMAYAIPNVISTYLAVSALADLGMLNLINVTRTAEWILSCRASNGAFQPYPGAEPTYLPGWSSLITNPFDVDRHSTGLPYTFAAVEALKRLSKLDSLGTEGRDNVTQYLLSCRSQFEDDFCVHPDRSEGQPAYTYYAMMTLSDIGMLRASGNVSVQIVKTLLGTYQTLKLDGSWPVPQPVSYIENEYGLFKWSTEALGNTFYAVMILNSTGSLSSLNQLTPRAVATVLNLLLLSTVVAFVSSMTLFLYKARKTKQKTPVAEIKNYQGPTLLDRTPGKSV